MLRGLYTGKILAPNLTSHTIMALLSWTSLKRAMIKRAIALPFNLALKGFFVQPAKTGTVTWQSVHKSGKDGKPGKLREFENLTKSQGKLREI